MAVKIGLPDKGRQVQSPEVDEGERGQAGSPGVGSCLALPRGMVCSAGVRAHATGTFRLGNSGEF